MNLKHAILVGFGCALSGCNASEEEEEQFTYDGADMEALVVGTWSGDLTPEGGTPNALTLSLDSVNEQGSLEPACAHRTFSVPGGGLRLTCASGSSLMLEGTLTVSNGLVPATEVQGEFSVWSLHLGGGFLSVQTVDSRVWLSATRNDAGAWQECYAELDGTRVSCSLNERE